METSWRTCCRVLYWSYSWGIFDEYYSESRGVHSGWQPPVGWNHGLPKEAGYAYGINPGLLLFDLCKESGIQEVSIYCFTQDNNKRPSIQKQAFTDACVTFALEIARRGAALLVVGDRLRHNFPGNYRNSGIVKAQG